MITAGTIAAIVSALAAAGTVGYEIYKDSIPEPVPIPDPTLAEIIAPFIPQVIIIIIAIVMYLMYCGIIKKYKKQVITFLYPIISSLVYIVALYLLLIINALFNIPVIVLFVDILLTIYYIYNAIQIFKGKKTSKKIWIKK